MSAERVVQAAIVEALRESDAFSTLVPGGVHDGDAPEGTEMPYTIVGEMTEVLDRTHDLDGYAHTITLHDWSSYEGRKECQEIREARNAVLHNAQLSVTGWGLTKITYELGEILTEWDPELAQNIRHQVTRYRVLSLVPAL